MRVVTNQAPIYHNLGPCVAHQWETLTQIAVWHRRGVEINM